MQPDYDEIDENGYKAFATTRPSKEKLLSTDKKYGEKFHSALSFTQRNHMSIRNISLFPACKMLH